MRCIKKIDRAKIYFMPTFFMQVVKNTVIIHVCKLFSWCQNCCSAMHFLLSDVLHFYSFLSYLDGKKGFCWYGKVNVCVLHA